MEEAILEQKQAALVLLAALLVYIHQIMFLLYYTVQSVCIYAEGSLTLMI
jgi:hypothetical protein